MILVQALKELRRTPEMFIQLKTMYGSVASIPVKVFLTGATMQMVEVSGSNLGPIFEEYLAKWRYTDDQVYVLNGGQESSSNGLIVTSIMAAEQYLEVAELYTVTFLSIASRETENAISWAEKAELIEQDRSAKKLHALRSAANKKSPTAIAVQQSAERNLSASMNGSTPSTHEDAPKSMAPAYNGKAQGLKKSLPKSIQPNLERVTNQFDPLFWWFHSSHVLRRKSAGLKRVVFQHASSLRRAFFDALQLAFSVQMNPLAAVQQVPQALEEAGDMM